MGKLLAILQLLSIILLLYFDFKRRSSVIFLWAVLFVMFGFPHFVAVLFDISNYNNDTMLKASIYVLMFNIVYMISRFVFVKSTKIKSVFLIDFKEFRNLNNFHKRHLKIVILVFLLVNIIFLGIIIIYLGNLKNLNWGSYYNLSQNCIVGRIFLLMKYLFFISTSVLLVLKYKKSKLTFLLYLFSISVILVLFGSREFLIPVLVTFIAPYVFNKNKRVSLKTIIVLSILGIFSVYIIYSVRIITRTSGGLIFFLSNFDLQTLNKLILEQILTSDGELGLRNVFYYFIEKNNNFPDFNKGHTYLRLVMLLIPTKLSFGLKPSDFAITMGKAWAGDFTNNIYSVHPTFYGDLFANFSWFGICFGIFWAIFITVFDFYASQKDDYYRTIVLMLTSSMYVMIARGSVYNPIYMTVINLLFLSIVNKIARVKIV